MRRRRLLASLGVSTAVVTAGCIGADDPDGETAASTDTAEPGWRASDGDGGERSGDPEGCSCPPHPAERERAVCSHTVDESSAPVFLVADPERSGLDGGAPAERIALILRNRSSGELRFNPASWRIWHDPGDGWTELEPSVSGDGVVTVAAGESYDWTFLEAVESIRPEPALEPGRYVAEIGVPDPSGGGWLACVALIELEGR